MTVVAAWIISALKSANVQETRRNNCCFYSVQKVIVLLRSKWRPFSTPVRVPSEPKNAK